MPTINLYRNISIIFIIFAVILLVAVFLLFSGSATIFITPNSQDINLSFNLGVKGSPTEAELAENDIVSGQLITYAKSGSGSFEYFSFPSYLRRERLCFA